MPTEEKKLGATEEKSAEPHIESLACGLAVSVEKGTPEVASTAVPTVLRMVETPGPETAEKKLYPTEENSDATNGVSGLRHGCLD